MSLPTSHSKQIWFCSLAEGPRLVWAWVTAHSGQHTSQGLENVRWHHSYLRFSHQEGILRFCWVKELGSTQQLLLPWSLGFFTSLLWWSSSTTITTCLWLSRTELSMGRISWVHDPQILFQWLETRGYLFWGRREFLHAHFVQHEKIRTFAS